MTAQTGRTTFKFVDFIIDDTGGTLRSVPINSLSVVGLTYGEMELTAWQDAVTGRLPTMADAPIDFGGPWDTTAAAAVGTLSGSHTVLDGLNGDLTPRTLDIHFGIRHAWETGEPQFGITQSSKNGYLITRYNVDPTSMTYTARAVPNTGSDAPAWGTTAETTA